MKLLSVVRSVKAKNEDSLLGIPGVTGVDSGKKITDGKRTDEPSIRIYVEKKKPLKDIPQNERIPKEIDGVKTDVIERKIVLHSTARMAVVDVKPMADTDTYDPLVGGISIGPCSAVGGYIYTGTLGCMVRDRSTGESLMLTNYHVIAEKWGVGEKICQPSRVDTGSCPSDTVGELLRSVISENVDGAVAKITARSNNCTIHEIGKITGTKAATDNMKVRKRGRTTGLTHGIVDSIDLTVNVPYDDGVHTLKNQIGIIADTAHGTVIGKSGDSGSVVVADDGKVVGLYFAGTEDGDFGVANPIAAVLDELDIDMCTNIARPEKLIREDFDFKWLQDGILKDRYKERAYEKLISFEYIDWDYLWKVNPPDWRGGFGGGWGGGGGAWSGGWGGGRRSDASGSFDPALEARLARLEAMAGAAPHGSDASVAPAAARCTDFAGMAEDSYPNPYVTGGATFQVFDHTGAPASQNRIDGFGLNAGFRAEISHARCNSIEITLIRTHNQAPTVRAFNGAGAEVDSRVMTAPQSTPETITLNGSGIVRVVVTSPQNEVWIYRYCHCSGKDRFKIEKFESKEIKEFKETIKERLKEIIKEKPEKREIKEWKEPKELKDGPKELKEGAKEFKEDFKEKGEPKPYKEKPEPKELAEGPGGWGGGWGGDPKSLREPGLDNPGWIGGGGWGGGGGKPISGPGDLQQRLARLEAMLGGRHFIGSDLRPDLSRGALTREPDCGCRH